MKLERVARQPDMHVPVPLPDLNAAESWLGGENLLGPALGNAVVAALDYFDRRDMTVAVQEIASVGVHHGDNLPRIAQCLRLLVDCLYGR
jgi:hypothetical protein